MPGYDSFCCPNCEGHFRVIWPEPMPSHHHRCSKIKIKCPSCGDVSEPYDFLLARIKPDPQPGIASVEPLSISQRDPNPDPDAAIKWLRDIFTRRAARYKAMYGN